MVSQPLVVEGKNDDNEALASSETVQRESAPPIENTEEMEVYLNSLTDLDNLLKKTLNKEGSVIERRPFSEYPKGFDFKLASIATQNLIEAIHYNVERGIDISSTITSVDMGPELAYDSADKTLIVSPGATAEDIKKIISDTIEKNISKQPEEVEGAPETKEESDRKVLAAHGATSIEGIDPHEREAVHNEILRARFDLLVSEEEKRMAEKGESRSSEKNHIFKRFLEDGRHWWGFNTKRISRFSLTAALMIMGSAFVGTYNREVHEDPKTTQTKTIESPQLKKERLITDTKTAVREKSGLLVEAMSGEREEEPIVREKIKVGTEGDILNRGEAIFVPMEEEAKTVEPQAESNNELAPNIVSVELGSSTWKFTAMAAVQIDPSFEGLDESQKTYVISPFVSEALDEPEEHGLPQGGILKIGDKVDLSKLIHSAEELKARIGKALKLSEEQKLTIVKNNKRIENWLREHPHEELNENKVAEILAAEEVVTETAVEPKIANKVENKATEQELRQQIFEAKVEASGSSIEEIVPEKRSMMKDLEKQEKDQFQNVTKNANHTLFSVENPLVVQAFINDVDQIYGKDKLWRHIRGIDCEEWKFVSKAPADKFMNFFRHNSEESNLNANIKEALASEPKHKQMFEHLEQLIALSGGKMEPKANENLETFMKRLGAQLMFSSEYTVSSKQTLKAA
jgi:hypothetical protein